MISKEIGSLAWSLNKMSLPRQTVAPKTSEKYHQTILTSIQPHYNNGTFINTAVVVWDAIFGVMKVVQWCGGRGLPLLLSTLLIHSLVIATGATGVEDTIEYENDFDGTNAAVSRELRVNVINRYDFPVEVYYDNNQGGVLLV